MNNDPFRLSAQPSVITDMNHIVPTNSQPRIPDIEPSPLLRDMPAEPINLPMELDLVPKVSEQPQIEEKVTTNQTILNDEDAIMQDIDPKERLQKLQEAMNQTDIEAKFLCYQADPDLIEISKER